MFRIIAILYFGIVPTTVFCLWQKEKYRQRATEEGIHEQYCKAIHQPRKYQPSQGESK